MKKGLLVLLLAGVLAAGTVMTGCGAGASTDTGISAEAENVEIKAEELLSGTEYDVTDYVKLPKNYKNMDVEVVGSYDANEIEVRDYIDTYVLGYYPLYEEVDKEAVEVGDFANIAFVGRMDGEEFAGGSSDGMYLEIGSGDFIDGFEDGLIGHKVGETVVLELKFPENYSSAECAGRDVEFTVDILGICTKRNRTYVDVTDDFVASTLQSTYGVSTKQELHDYFQLQVQQIDQQYYLRDVQNAILDKLIEESEIEIPESVLASIDENVATAIETVKGYAEQEGKTPDEFCASMGAGTIAKYEEDLRNQITKETRQELAMEAIVADTKKSIMTADYDLFMQNMTNSYSQQYGALTVDQVVDMLGGRTYTMLQFAENRCLSDLVNSVKVTVTAPSSTETEEETAE